MATSELLSGVAFELSKQGVAVSALAGQPAYWKEGGDIPWVIEKDGVEVRRVRSTRLDKNTTLGRILNSTTFAFSIFINSLFRKQPDLFIAVTNPPLLIWVVRLVKLFRGTSYVLIIHDVYPDVAIALNRLGETSFISRLWRLLNRWSYRGAERIVVLGECMADVLREELPQAEQGKVVIIPNWADGEKIYPIPREENSLLKEWELEDKFVVQYSGNIGLFHEIETIVKAAEILKDNRKIHFLFIGEGGQLPWLKEKVSQLRLSNISFQPFQAKEKLPLSLTACDLALVTLKDVATGFCVPSKLYGILAAGKPVLGVVNSRAETARVIEAANCGIVIRPGDAESLARTIEQLSEDHKKCEQFGVAARAVFENEYTLSKIASQYADMFKGMSMFDQAVIKG
ncbi:MAG: glycosyltransferase family 4 protein [Bacteroidales bacterium]|nr:glycosyltransferase family 4 protein [Bacteroidales bacterium]